MIDFASEIVGSVSLLTGQRASFVVVGFVCRVWEGANHVTASGCHNFATIPKLNNALFPKACLISVL